MRGILPEGPRFSYYKLIDSGDVESAGCGQRTRPISSTASIPRFRDWRRGWAPIKSKVPWLRVQLQTIAKTVDDATAAADKDPQLAGASLLRGLDLTRALIKQC